MNTTLSFDVITAALDRVSGPGRKSGAWYRYLCPVHEGDGRHHNPSLGVIYNRAARRTVLRCFAGCSDEDVLDRLGLRVRDLFDRPPHHVAGAGHIPRARRPELSPVDRALLAAGLPLAVHKPGLGPAVGPSREVARYLYRWPDHRPEGRVHRVHAPHEHGRVKYFWQERMTENGWRPGGFARIPYRLPEVAVALAASADIYLCEGERDVQSALRTGVVATTNAGGAHAWTPAHAAWLRGAHRVWIVTDRDAPGYRRAAKAADTLLGFVHELRIVQPRDGNDLTDHLDAGHHLEDLDPVPILDAYATRGHQLT
ncbi:toprim domain-containing protein [Nocardia thraciensis]